MNHSRRFFFKSAAALGLLGAGGLPVRAQGSVATTFALDPATPTETRRYWVGLAERMNRPVLEALARGELRQRMPVEQKPGAKREDFAHLEAFGRLLAGLAPWLALPGLTGEERKLQTELLGLARAGLAVGTDPKSPDFFNFNHGGQPLVDAAFLALGLLRGRAELWEPLDGRVKTQIIAALKLSREIPTPTGSNWVMFAATVEAALLEMGEAPLPDRLQACVRRMLGWYCGDGAYGDGEPFHFDYYNSFVIHPMLLEVLGVLQKHGLRLDEALAEEQRRAQRYAAVQERLIAPDGTFPSLGRSTTYRLGAFQVLALMSLRRELPAHLVPAQVRTALTAVMRRMMEAPGTFDSAGWLQIGFCGHQPDLGESYISTGSLYLCATGLLPLGLPTTDEFWSAPAEPWTAVKLWSGQNLPADHALSETRHGKRPG